MVNHPNRSRRQRTQTEQTALALQAYAAFVQAYDEWQAYLKDDDRRFDHVFRLIQRRDTTRAYLREVLQP